MLFVIMFILGFIWFFFAKTAYIVEYLFEADKNNINFIGPKFLIIFSFIGWLVYFIILKIWYRLGICKKCGKNVLILKSLWPNITKTFCPHRDHQKKKHIFEDYEDEL
ncbi:MAG TPA: hypothetical protein PLK76_04230 [bacterium]|nr:hypothetical protein [bacterium]